MTKAAPSKTNEPTVKKKKKSFEHILEELEAYDEGCKSHDLMSSGE